MGKKGQETTSIPVSRISGSEGKVSVIYIVNDDYFKAAKNAPYGVLSWEASDREDKQVQIKIPQNKAAWEKHGSAAAIEPRLFDAYGGADLGEITKAYLKIIDGAR